jgi:hypothetical protein
LVTQRIRTAFESLSQLVSEYDNFAKLREEMKRPVPICVPFLGMRVSGCNVRTTTDAVGQTRKLCLL